MNNFLMSNFKLKIQNAPLSVLPEELVGNFCFLGEYDPYGSVDTKQILVIMIMIILI